MKPYWASEDEPKRFISRALERVSWHHAELRTSGRWDSMLTALNCYYGRGVTGDQKTRRLGARGASGELTTLAVNRFRPVLQNVHSIVCSTRPSMKPVATNASAESAAQTRFAMGLTQYYETKLRAANLEEDAMRLALLCGSASYVQRWAPSAGAEVAYDVDDDRIVYEGDIEEFIVPPWRIAYEKSVAPKPRWCIFRARENRHDLAARARSEELREKLLGRQVLTEGSTSSRDYIETTANLDRSLAFLLGDDLRSEDEVWVWEVRHLPTPALPLGRLVRFVEPDMVLFDSASAGEPAQADGDAPAETMEREATATKFPYEELHAYEVSPERNPASGSGHTFAFDLGALQELHDLATTSIATTLNLLSLPTLWQPGGGVPQRHDLDVGIQILETPTKPELVDFPAVKAEVLQAVEWLSSTMNQIAALNDTVMGNPQKGMPASAQALQRAQAVSFHAPTQGDWIRLVGEVVNGRLRMLKRFARSERVAEIAGGGDTWELRNWSREDLADVPRFQVEPVNPMSATFEGRQAIAEQMGIQGEALFDFVTTGSLKKVTEAKTLQLELVERNKALLLRGVGLPPVDMDASMAKGEPVFVQGEGETLRVLRSDPHHLAIPAYLSVLGDPQSRTSDELVSAVLDVVSESLRLWASLTKDECVAFGLPPLPSTLESLPPGTLGAPQGGAPAAPGGSPVSERPKPEAKTQTELPAPARKPPEPAESPDGRETAVSDLGLSGAQA